MELLLDYFPALVTPNKNCDETLQHWLLKSFFNGLKDQAGGWGGGEELTKSGTWGDVLTTTHMLVSDIFRQLTTSVVVLDVVTKLLMIGSVCFFR